MNEQYSGLAAAILHVQNRRWWQWWKPKISQERMEQIVREALTGEKEPLRTYGVVSDE